MKKILAITGLIWLSVTARANDIINQPCPNFVFDTLINHAKTRLTIGDMKGKFVLLDFWGTFCAPCVAEIPMMEQLQKKFEGKLQILMVGVDGYQKALDFYAMRTKNNKAMALPTAMSMQAKQYFQVNAVPTYVWIDDQGIVRAITDDSQVTEEKLAAFLHHETVQIRQNENRERMTGKTPLLSLIDSAAVLYHSSFTGYLPGYSELTAPPWRKRKKIMFVNRCLQSLYQLAFGDSADMVLYGRVLLECAHPEKICPTNDVDYAEWRKANTYCYELSVPPDRQKDIYRIMQQDLERYLDYTASWETRVRRCLVLKKIKDVDFSANKDSVPFTRYNTSSIRLINRPFRQLVSYIQHYHQDIVVIDETGIPPHNITLILKADVLEPAFFNQALEPFGLRLDYEDRKVDMLIIKDKKKES